MAQYAAIIRKKPTETFPISLIYRAPDLPTGVTILSTVPTVTPSGLTLGTNGVLPAGNEVYCWIIGGTTLIDYVVRFTSTLSDTKTLVDDVLIKCRN